jgi:hypothetical protein
MRGRDMSAPTTDCQAVLRARAAVSEAYRRRRTDPAAETDLRRAYDRMTVLEIVDAEEDEAA